MRFYAPYVAPCSTGPEDPRLYEFLYTQIGDDAYGAEQAEEMRGLVTAFQVDMLKNKETLLPTYEAIVLGSGFAFQEGVAIDQIYDVNVLEFAVQFWQNQMVSFDDLRSILEMPETTPEELQAKMQAEFGMMLQVQAPMDWSIDMVAWPYYVNAVTTYGQYHYDFSYLRKALEAAGVADTLSVTEEMEDGLLWSIVFSKEQRAAFAWNDSFETALSSYLDTTSAKVLMVFGATDPWIALRIPKTDNPNVVEFVHPTAPHSAMLSTLPEEMMGEVSEVLQNWLQ